MNRRPQPSDFGLSPLADNVDALTQRSQSRQRISRIHHGVGGGMRFADDHELVRHTSSRFSGEFMGRTLSLSGPRVVAGVYCTVLVTILLVTHIHLRFEIHDIKMQEHSLQTVQRQLEQRLSSLDRGVAKRMADLAPMRDVATRHMNMVRNSRSVELGIAPHVAQKYSPEAIVAATQPRDENPAAHEEQARSPFNRLADFALAFMPN